MSAPEFAVASTQDAPAWEVEAFWRESSGEDPRASFFAKEASDWLEAEGVRASVSDLYYLRGENLDETALERATRRLLSDPVVQTCEARSVVGATTPGLADGAHTATVRKKTGVMEPAEASLLRGLADLGIDDVEVRLAQRVRFHTSLDTAQKRIVAEKILSNPAIEDVFWDEDSIPSPFAAASPYELEIQSVHLSGLSDDELIEVSKTGQLSLDLEEMRTIRDHFAELGREPTDAELETLAQTWSEHCCHKTLTARIEHKILDESGAEIETTIFENLLRETIARATDEVRERETEPFCLSVFKDNAGVVAFDDELGISFKVETHNHPSAIEPYGGAGTGIGGVLRDTLGTGLGAKPIVNTDVFCFGPPDLPRDQVPAGALHPMNVLRGVVSGVRDYGNRMGIPTASGALYFDERYVGNPLVYCGSVGVIPRDKVDKDVHPGDRIVALGGRTGRDGIHGATFSSVELTEESETLSSGAVQIGNAITEKKVLDVLLEARDLGLYRGVTDCGAGGFSSAVGEMGELTGARVDLNKIPLKYEGLSYWEIWISEAQERMVFAVPPERLDELVELSDRHDVECVDFGEFTDTGRLELFYDGQSVCDLSMKFLHDGRPAVTRPSTFRRTPAGAASLEDASGTGAPKAGELLKRILSSPNVASKEWVIRQYDHEVQGRSALKPLVGVAQDGPGDASVFLPKFDSLRGVAVACGMNPCYGDLDPYRMALSAFDESFRNVIAVGGNPGQIAVLDNFCWGNTDRPETLGSLVEAARGCYDAAIALGAPFISGKDSLNNEFRTADGLLSIPPSLLISSIAMVDDATKCVSMDLKGVGNRLVLVGETRRELGGSHALKVLDREGGEVPDLPANALAIHEAVARVIASGRAKSCHDLSEGGLAVAAAEMAFSGDIGAEISLEKVPVDTAADLGDLEVLFSESNTRYLLEVSADQVDAVLAEFDGLPAADVGETLDYHIFRCVNSAGDTVVAEAIADLKRAWQAPLAF